MKSYILTFTMLDMPHPVWRRVIMPEGATFNRLHSVIQDVTNFQSYYTDSPYHFFEINVDGLCITDNPIRRDELKGTPGITPKQPTRLKIDEILENHNELIYEYDLGDGWRFLIELDSIVENYHFGFPTLLDGEGEAPPEDVGGPPGYAAFLETIANPDDPEYDHMITWARSNGYRPYNKDRINQRLKSVKYQKTDWDQIDHVNHKIVSDPYRDPEISSEGAGSLPPSAPKAEAEAQTGEKPAAPLTDEEKELEQYIRAMVNLYGFTEADHVGSLYSRQNGKALTGGELVQRVASSALESRLQEDVILVRNNHFLGPKLAHIDPDLFFKEIAGKPYYEPAKEQLLRYAEAGYYDRTPELEQLEELFLQEHIPQLQIDRMLHGFMHNLSVWHANFMDAVSRLMDQAGPLAEESVNRIISAAVLVSNNVRLIENRGFTPQELHQLGIMHSAPQSGAPVQPSGKIGRNDPCPCGSGKKYKKCCGRY
ncbi:hypothetical protein NCCP2716_17490 [Sporosarcina sp. NCCP-2716]|uniref:IS1096 element passenger TnpR family protein n=1 Tax=Sporosarcina sp. NCCP-2716 TaxID=2943679 RepID=UPI00203AD43C|nr:SEC-C metal-binding domain-containing protein [Sporosarcina sp. NCCP-2716]GKV69251.1 hypothetical protein NCCP2716_17490 [Sporosarcina sp. NCCP-2716]